MSEDPNFEETSLFDFVNPEEKKETKKKAPLSAAPVKEKKRSTCRIKKRRTESTRTARYSFGE